VSFYYRSIVVAKFVKMSIIDINKELLIALVEERPVLWDKSDDIYKDRDATRKAWNEVCLGLKEDIATLGDSEKNIYLVSTYTYFTV
jgi:hypothetical protein